MRFLGLLCVAAVSAQTPWKTGLAQPRGIFAGKSSVWVAEAGNGAPWGEVANCGLGPEGPGCLGDSGRIKSYSYDGYYEGSLESDLPSWAGPNLDNAVGVHDVHVDDDGIFYLLGGIPTVGTNATTGVIIDPSSCKIVHVMGTTVNIVADFYAFEWANNVDGQDKDCDPYRFVRDADGSFVVTDAAANAVYRAYTDGRIETIGVWENDGWTQAVPTGVALGKNGEIYVGNFYGYPFTTGKSQVRKYAADGSNVVIGTGFTGITDVVVDNDGNVWVLEMSPSLLTINATNPPFATLTRIDLQRGGEKATFFDYQLFFGNGLAISPYGEIYVGSNTLGGNVMVTCPAQCTDTGFLYKFAVPAYTPPPPAPEKTSTVINFNFAGLFNGLGDNNPARR